MNSFKNTVIGYAFLVVTALAPLQSFAEEPVAKAPVTTKGSEKTELDLEPRKQDDSQVIASKFETPASVANDVAKVHMGTYEPYTLADRVRVGANMFANPSRLQTVSLAQIYSPMNVDKSDDKIIAGLYAGLALGKVSFVKLNNDGSYETETWSRTNSEDYAKLRISFLNSCAAEVGQLEAAQEMQNTDGISKEIKLSEECRTAVLKALGFASNNRVKLISSVPELTFGKSDGKVINWTANYPVNDWHTTRAGGVVKLN